MLLVFSDLLIRWKWFTSFYNISGDTFLLLISEAYFTCFVLQLLQLTKPSQQDL